jgi:predicted membrane GTPase involved in stress response
MCANSATKDATTVLSAPIQMGLDDSLEYLAEDELVEVLLPPQCCLLCDLPHVIPLL